MHVLSDRTVLETKGKNHSKWRHSFLSPGPLLSIITHFVTSGLKSFTHNCQKSGISWNLWLCHSPQLLTAAVCIFWFCHESFSSKPKSNCFKQTFSFKKQTIPKPNLKPFLLNNVYAFHFSFDVLNMAWSRTGCLDKWERETWEKKNPRAFWPKRLFPFTWLHSMNFLPNVVAW